MANFDRNAAFSVKTNRNGAYDPYITVTQNGKDINVKVSEILNVLVSKTFAPTNPVPNN